MADGLMANKNIDDRVFLLPCLRCLFFLSIKNNSYPFAALTVLMNAVQHILFP